MSSLHYLIVLLQGRSKRMFLSGTLICIITTSCTSKKSDFRTDLEVIHGVAESYKQSYINPLDIDYTYMVYNSNQNLSYRSGADPAVIEFRGEYYMFVTRSFGYWYSKDLINWKFIKPKQWYFEGSNAPTAFNYRDSLVYFSGNPAGYGSILYSDNPKEGIWKATASISDNIQDAELFIDDDGETYLYWGSSNTFPIRVKSLNRKDRFLETGIRQDLIQLDEEEHGWERFGENNFHPTIKKGYIEGASITKHDGKYYLQYAAPGTQFNVYADGAYIGESPLGPFTYMPNNPMSFKPGGFSNGTGHGVTLKQINGQYWHFATMALASNSQWERRLCMFPVYFDKDGLMHSDTSYGDYPRFSPDHPKNAGEHNGWMLLSYKGLASVSSSFKQIEKSTTNDDEIKIIELDPELNEHGELITRLLTDENPKTFWVSDANDADQWVIIKFKTPGVIHAIQLNFHDYNTGIYTRMEGLQHQFIIETSEDGKHWQLAVDRANSQKDTPNAYIELKTPVAANFVRYRNIKVPGPNLALSEIRVFGKGLGEKPEGVKQFSVVRQLDRRDALIEWDSVMGAQGYNIRWGISPDKLYQSWLVYEETSLLMRNLDKNTSYYFTIEAFNENGISQCLPVIYIE